MLGLVAVNFKCLTPKAALRWGLKHMHRTGADSDGEAESEEYRRAAFSQLGYESRDAGPLFAIFIATCVVN